MEASTLVCYAICGLYDTLAASGRQAQGCLTAWNAVATFIPRPLHPQPNGPINAGGHTCPSTRRPSGRLRSAPRSTRASSTGSTGSRTRLELGLFGALWSEHCAYKHSRPLLGLFPSDSPRVLVSPGAENAGVVDVGGGLSVVFKIESHNHPSAVEPFQGAATGVGGIVRDILAMGARPIALLNSLRFGPADSKRTRRLFHGVVEGISWYGNCIGVPDVGGEITFAPCYDDNPLVNAMCIGIVRTDDLVRAQPSGGGDLLLLVGADTGRDGIHGASGLASQTLEDTQELRTTVQVGNPFLEKVLIEACLEALQTCPEGIAGMQDLGAAGLTSAAVECVSKGGRGLLLDVSQVPRRESGMNPYEVMLSESQERMLLLVRPGFEDAVRAVFDKWDLTSSVIGSVTDDATVRIHDAGEPAAHVPVEHLVDAPRYRLTGVRSAETDAARNVDLSALPLPDMTPRRGPPAAARLREHRQPLRRLPPVRPAGAGEHGGGPGRRRRRRARPARELRRPSHPARHRRRHRRQQPHDVAGPLRRRPARRRRGLPQRVVRRRRAHRADGLPELRQPGAPGGLLPARGVHQGHGRSLPRPRRARGQRQREPLQRGRLQAIYPTPVVGALGLLEDVSRHCGAGFRNEGDVVLLLGASSLDGDAATLAGSEALETLHGVVAGQPALDIDLEARVQRLCRDAVRRGLLASAHDCSDGGLAVALAESCILGNLGATITAAPRRPLGRRPLRRGPVPHPRLPRPKQDGRPPTPGNAHNVPGLGRTTPQSPRPPPRPPCGRCSGTADQTVHLIRIARLVPKLVVDATSPSRTRRRPGAKPSKAPYGNSATRGYAKARLAANICHERAILVSEITTTIADRSLRAPVSAHVPRLLSIEPINSLAWLGQDSCQAGFGIPDVWKSESFEQRPVDSPLKIKGIPEDTLSKMINAALPSWQRNIPPLLSCNKAARTSLNPALGKGYTW